MKESLQIIETLRHFVNELTEFKSNDLLVHIDQNKVISWNEETESLSPQLLKMIREGDKFEREQGIQTLTLSEGLVAIIHKQTEVQSPMFLYNLKPTIQKGKQSIKWEVDWDRVIINPFLVKTLQFNTQDLEGENTKAFFLQFLEDQGLPFELEPKYLGHFHPHRYALLKETEGLLEKDDLEQLESVLIGGEKTPHPLALNAGWLYHMDGSQEKALQALEHENILIQGPPGTGKSQVIANLIGKAIAEHHKVLVCSEKKAALEVLFQKLKEHQLEDFCLLRSQHLSSKYILKDLKDTWNGLSRLSYLKIEPCDFLDAFQTLQRTLKAMRAPEIFGTLSPLEFMMTHQPKLSKKAIDTKLPSYSEWEKWIAVIDKIPYSILIDLSFINTSQSLTQTFEKLLSQVTDLMSGIETLKLQKASFHEIHQNLLLAQKAHNYESPIYLKFKNLTGKATRIKKLDQDLGELTLSLSGLEDSMKAWNQMPTLEELHFIEQKTGNQSIWNSVSRKRILKKWFRTPGADLKTTLKKTSIYLKQKQKLQETKRMLFELGFDQPETDLNVFKVYLSVLNSEDFKRYELLPVETKHFYATSFSMYNRIYHDLKSHFNFKDQDIPYDYLSNWKVSHVDCLPFIKAWDEIPISFKDVFRNYKDFESLEKAHKEAAWSRFILKSPEFERLNAKGFLLDIKQLNKDFKAQSKNFAQHLKNNRLHKFETYHALIETPNLKLSESDRKLKIQLKKGKSILVKAFAKQRNLPTIGQLMKSEALLWIQLLKPIWLTNPIHLAEDLPLDAGAFELGIMDESSQIPLAHGLGTFYRSKRFVIAGDSQQMPPSSFFQSGAKELISVLDHCTYYLKNYKLNYHYRSQHPQLIQFSNDNFYEGSLVPFPEFGAQKKPIELKYIENAIYEAGTNLMEAVAVAKQLIEALEHKKDRIGLVAFSQAQVKLIIESVPASKIPLIESAIEDDLLFFKSLDQVQGDECDVMIISFGYGMNPQGEFELRFGPINQEGGSKRLNVLLSRARKKIYFFTSVKSSDFPKSENESIKILKKWFEFLENLKLDSAFSFPFDVEGKTEDKHIRVSHFATVSDRVSDLMAIEYVLSKRGWELH